MFLRSIPITRQMTGSRTSILGTRAHRFAVLPAVIAAILAPTCLAQADGGRGRDRHGSNRQPANWGNRDHNRWDHDRDHDHDVDFNFRFTIGRPPVYVRQRQVIYLPPPPPPPLRSRRVVVYTPPARVIYCPPPRPVVYFPAPPPPLVVYCPPPAPRCDTVIMRPAPVVIDRPIVIPREASVEVEQLPQPAGHYFAIDLAAWNDLNTGQYTLARQQFLELIDVNPGEAVPQVGFSLSNSLLDHDYEAPKAMRQAIILNADVLWAVGRSHPELHNEIGQMIGHYETLASIDSRNFDNYFMVAAGHTMMGEWEAAGDAIPDAISRGDQSQSTLALKSYIDSHRGAPLADAR